MHFANDQSKGYQKAYDLGKLEEHLKILKEEYNVGFIMVDE